LNLADRAAVRVGGALAAWRRRSAAEHISLYFQA